MKFLDTVRLMKIKDHLDYMTFLIKTMPKIRGIKNNDLSETAPRDELQ